MERVYYMERERVVFLPIFTEYSGQNSWDPTNHFSHAGDVSIKAAAAAGAFASLSFLYHFGCAVVPAVLKG